MRLFFAIVGLMIPALAGAALAQTEGQDLPDSPTPVVIAQPPLTRLDTLNQMPGLTQRSLTRVSEMTDDTGGVLTVYTVTIEQHGKDAAGKSVDSVERGLSLLIAPRNGTKVRAYIDADHIQPMLDGIQSLAELDRSGSNQTIVRGVYRDQTVTIANIDDANGRTAVVRLLQVTPVTNQAMFASIRFRSTRLAELTRQLKTAKDMLDKQSR